MLLYWFKIELNTIALYVKLVFKQSPNQSKAFSYPEEESSYKMLKCWRNARVIKFVFQIQHKVKVDLRQNNLHCSNQDREASYTGNSSNS